MFDCFARQIKPLEAMMHVPEQRAPIEIDHLWLVTFRPGSRIGSLLVSYIYVEDSAVELARIDHDAD
jgi:hypothetical protein